MKKRSFLALFCVIALVTALITPASAAEVKETIVDLGDGFYAIETISYGPVARSGDTVNGTKSASLYQGSTLVGTATLLAYFDISGATAKATRAVISGTGSNGWTYDHGTTSLSGNKATGTAYFKANGVSKSLTLTLTCSPDGTLS